MKISLFLTILGSSFALACGPSASEDPTSGSSGSSGSTGDSATATATATVTVTDTMSTASASDTMPTTSDTTPTTTDTTPTTTDADTTAGTDATTTDATTGDTTGTGDSGSSTDPGTTTGGEVVDYGPCDFTDPENPTCPEGQICQVTFGGMDGDHWCGVPCMDSIDDCPASPNDSAIVECSGLGLCALDCGADGELACPDGMECVEFGSGTRCVWPAPV